MKKGKCMVCGLPVEGWGDYGEMHRGRFNPEGWDQINGAVVGEYIVLQGHRRCLNAVDDLVIGPNRMRVDDPKFVNKLSNRWSPKMQALYKKSGKGKKQS